MYWVFVEFFFCICFDVYVVSENIVFDDGDVIMVGVIFVWNDFGFLIVDCVMGVNVMLVILCFMFSEGVCDD